MKGVDFGTSTSLMAKSSAFRTDVIPLGRSEMWLPSVVGATVAGLVPGEDALALQERQLIRSIKSSITRNESTVRLFDGNDDIDLDVDAIIGTYLAHLRSVTEGQFLPLDDMAEVRLGCPAMWTGAQRQRLINIASIAGIGAADHTVIDEPIAAGIAWVSKRLEDHDPVKGKVLVFDMGGGTLDVAVLNVLAENGRDISISVQSAYGIDQAGDSLDEKMANDFAAYLRRTHGLNPLDDPELMGWIRRGASEAKIELSSSTTTSATFYHPRIDVPSVPYTREQLVELFVPQLAGAMDVVWRSLRAALMTQVNSAVKQNTLTLDQARRLSEDDLAKDVDYVVLVGGMSMVPAVRERLGEVFPQASLWMGDQLATEAVMTNPNQLVARGLAYSDGYHNINLHHPGFDFILSWEGGEGARTEEVIYAAYSPLHTTETVFRYNSLKYFWRPGSKELPRAGDGEIGVRTLGGNKIGVRDGEHLLSGIPYSFGPNPNQVVTLDPSGRIFIRDGMGNERATRVAQWPVIRAEGGIAELIIDPVTKHWPTWKLVWHEIPYD